jgi:hypothetical protein
MNNFVKSAMSGTAVVITSGLRRYYERPSPRSRARAQVRGRAGDDCPASFFIVYT